MALNAKVSSAAIIATFLILSQAGFPVTNALESDIYCLKSMKESLQDPLDYLRAWKFDNFTEGFIGSFGGIDCWHAYENKVLNVRLSNMGLKGQFPRGLQNCTSLTGLDLSNNQLSGPIPSDIGKMLKYLTALDLSNNQFSGLIPPSIANCRYLASLKLDNNSLWGPIPRELGMMDRLKVFSVAGNRLTGPVPNFTGATPTKTNFRNNLGLCGLPLEPCKDASVAGPSTRVLFVSGFMTGWAVGTGLVLFLCFWGMPRIPLKKQITRKHQRKKTQVESRKLWPKAMEINNNQKIAKLEKYVTRLSFAELTNATSNFSEDYLIGTGKMGTMYKATIPNGWFLAIKRLFNSELDRQIASEIITLGKLRHCRLVPLLGFCLEKKDLFLVYKYMSNGNLYNLLHTRKGDGVLAAVHWRLRVKVAVGVAEGLAWLHHNCNYRVVHGAISSTSVLLDKYFEPKISNFWEAKFIKSKDQSSNWSFFQTGDSLVLDSLKKDIYCFGILLLELITRKKPQHLARIIANICDTSVSSKFSTLHAVDESLIGQGFDDEILQCLQVAKNCLLSRPDRRPSMLQVYESLEAFAKIYNQTGNSETSH